MQGFQILLLRLSPNNGCSRVEVIICYPSDTWQVGEILNVHLGHSIGIADSEKVAITCSIQEVVWRSNYLAKVGFCTGNVGSFLYRTYYTNY